MASKLVAVLLFLGLLQGCGNSQSPGAPSPLPAPTPTPSAPLPIVGAYRFKITMDSECRDPFPKAFQIRSYDVDIRPVGDHSEIWFDSPNVVHLPETNLAPGTGFMSEGFFNFHLFLIDSVHEDQPSPYRFFVDAGASVFLEPPNGPPMIDGPLFAVFTYADLGGATPPCVSSSHHFVFSPR